MARHVSALAVVVMITGAIGAAQVAPQPRQEPIPTFRSAVDLIAVEVQVVGDDGTPIGHLHPEDFTVSISGQPRRVISADYVRTTAVDGRPFLASSPSRPAATNMWPSEAGSDEPGRTYVLAFDVGSLSVPDSRAVVSTALTFVDRLLPTDLVGLYTFPMGQVVDPTTDHAGVKKFLEKVVGGAQTYRSIYNLSPSEIIDITAESTRMVASRMTRRQDQDRIILTGAGTITLREVEARECRDNEFGCVEDIQQEAKQLSFYLEALARVSLNGMRSMISALADYPGRKTVMMFSSGIPISDRPGGRPDLGQLPEALGREAAATNTTIYTVHIDTTEFRAMSAETRRPPGSPVTRSRDFAVGGRALHEFSAASGGALLRVVTGSGEYALSRVLRETSSHYLLGVEPDEDDRNGEPRPLQVRVDGDVTVRSRTWVVVPERN